RIGVCSSRSPQRPRLRDPSVSAPRELIARLREGEPAAVHEEVDRGAAVLRVPETAPEPDAVLLTDADPAWVAVTAGGTLRAVAAAGAVAQALSLGKRKQVGGAVEALDPVEPNRAHHGARSAQPVV